MSGSIGRGREGSFHEFEYSVMRGWEGGRSGAGEGGGGAWEGRWLVRDPLACRPVGARRGGRYDRWNSRYGRAKMLVGLIMGMRHRPVPRRLLSQLADETLDARRVSSLVVRVGSILANHEELRPLWTGTKRRGRLTPPLPPLAGSIYGRKAFPWGMLVPGHARGQCSLRSSGIATMPRRDRGGRVSCCRWGLAVGNRTWSLIGSLATASVPLHVPARRFRDEALEVVPMASLVPEAWGECGGSMMETRETLAMDEITRLARVMA